MTENNNDALTQLDENTDSEIIAQLGQSRLVSIASSLSLTKTSVILKKGTLTGMGVQENNKTFFKGDLEDLTSISIEIFREIPLFLPSPDSDSSIRILERSTTGIQTFAHFLV